MHNAGMSFRPASPSLFHRLRRSAALRVVLVLAALLTSQQSLACAFEEVFSEQGTEIAVAADTAAPDFADCCGACLSCVNCSVCCSSAMDSPMSGSAFGSTSLSFLKISQGTAAPALWTPPTLLKPPIDAA